MNLFRIASRIANITNFKSFKYDIGDERAFGRLEFEADTPKGALKYEANINTDGEMEDEKAILDGEPVELDLGINLPHYYKIDPEFWTYTEEEAEEHREEQPSDEEAKQIVTEAIDYWISSGAETGKPYQEGDEPRLPHKVSESQMNAWNEMRSQINKALRSVQKDDIESGIESLEAAKEKASSNMIKKIDQAIEMVKSDSEKSKAVIYNLWNRGVGGSITDWISESIV